MPQLTFKVSDNQKFDFLWNLLNPNCTEENGWAIDYVICDVYDEYAIAYNYSEGIYERVYYIKDDANDSLSIDHKERCFILDVTENEKHALETLRSLNGNTYELVDEKFATIDGLNQKISENSNKIEELNTTISTLTVERDEAHAQLATADARLNDVTAQYNDSQVALAALTAERDELASYKKSAEDNAKKAVLTSYAAYVGADVLEHYPSNMDNYTVEQLDVMLTYEQKKAHPELFTQGAKPAYVPKDDTNRGGLEEILAKYERK